MHYLQREALIIEKLKQHGKVIVSDLAGEIGVNPMTIRRDLIRLEQQGLLQKVHGAAVPLDGLLKEKAFGEKQLIKCQQKRLIAREALELVKPGETILLDAGTTTFEVALLLRHMPGVNVVTNDLHIAMELCSAEGRLFYVGGEIEKDLGRSAGAKAFQFLSDIHVDTVFLGISAVNSDLMLCSHTVDNAELKRAMLNCGSRKVLLADESKFGTNAFARIGPLSLVDIMITDKTFGEVELGYLEANQVVLRQVLPEVK
ncbi:MAG: DeoR/GlpR transcriptional regulator [Desulfuromonadales bacterium]|nr:DeoR/GlpR transcriptional regulator [Desulfuromonadales bacterium]